MSIGIQWKYGAKICACRTTQTLYSLWKSTEVCSYCFCGKSQTFCIKKLHHFLWLKQETGAIRKQNYNMNKILQPSQNKTPFKMAWPLGCSYCNLRISKTIQEYKRRLVYKIKITGPNFAGFVSPERCYCLALGMSLPYFYRKVQ